MACACMGCPRANRHVPCECGKNCACLCTLRALDLYSIQDKSADALDAARYRALRHEYVIKRRYNGCAEDYDHLNIGFYNEKADKLIADSEVGK